MRMKLTQWRFLMTERVCFPEAVTALFEYGPDDQHIPLQRAFPLRLGNASCSPKPVKPD